ncbi:hypothetical protein HYALB_00008678 [Hymenoscyphus albidus]|uniref:C2H2-type domain-containing protein n=1 Tax=Hymenoscyphus albidus TaxID=595503 RepID=A0A9N9LIG2_9HELO|nr:hypothetical protein HYALB_00008678 [Hymenoscyphus albidus]
MSTVITASHPLPTAFMDSLYIDPATEDSRQSRSRTNSHLSSTALQFQGLNIFESDSDQQHFVPVGFRTTSPQSFIEQDPDPSNSHISSPIPQDLTPFPLLSDSELDADWSYLEEPTTGGLSGSTPYLRLDPSQSFQRSHSSQSLHQPSTILRSNSIPANMSTVGIQQYDSRFDAGIRPSYTWPRKFINQVFCHTILTIIDSFQMEEQHMSCPPLNPSMLSAYDDPKLMPMYARSLSSSPPRGTLTPEQRELKRQRDHARRDSKTRARRERSVSNPYVVSNRTSPDLMPRTLPEYSSSLTPSPLLAPGPLPSNHTLPSHQAHPSPALSSSSYLTPYSPAMPDTSNQEMYGPVFTMSPADFANSPTFTPMPYTQTGPEGSIHNYVGRPHSLSSASDQPHMYSHSHSHTHHPSPNSKVGSSDNGDHVRVVTSRPKPQCWEHGCNGRQFSTFSNLLRHQREKSGAAAKSSCPNCGAEFTRTTARNGHMAHEKCKQRRNS